MTTSQRLFLSYRTLERGFALRLAADLRATGLPVWMDCMDIPPGSNWDQAIAEAIGDCSGLLAVLSPAYVSSTVCLDELARAQRLGKPILIVLLEPFSQPNDWPLLIERRQYIEFLSWTDSATYRSRLDQLIEAINRSFTFGPSLPQDAEAAYLDDLQARLQQSPGVLQYITLGATAADPVRERDADESGFDTMLEIEAASGQRRATRWQDLEALLPQVRRLVVLGDAGSGKTTTLRWLALRGLSARRAKPRGAPLPVFAPLAQWEKGRSFAEFLRDACPLLGAVRPTLSGSDTLLLLDGLNEMGPDAPEKVQALAVWIGEQSTPPQIALTCRPAEFAQLGLTGFTVASLRPLEPDQIRQFASRYLLSSSLAFLDQILPASGKMSADRSLLADLAQNPYMLSALIYLFQATPNAPLPNNPGALFTLLGKALWTRQDRRRQTAQRPALPSWQEAGRQLGELALATVEGEEAEDMPLQRAEAALGAELLLGALDAGLLTKFGAFVRFAHDLLRVTLGAQALRDTDATAFNEWCRRHVRQWEPMAVAWSGISKNADAFLEHANWQDAAQLVGKGYVVSDSALGRPVQRALEELGIDHWRSFQPAMDALIMMGRRCVPLLIEALGTADANLRAKIAFVLGRIGDERAVPALLPLLQDREGEVAGRAYSALCSIPSPAAWRALASDLGDATASRRQQAVQALKKLGESGDASAAPAVRALLQDVDSDVRRAAILALGELRDGPSAEAVHAFLADEQAETRATALRSLALIGHPDLSGAVKRALDDSDEPVQLAALESVAALDRETGVSALLAALRSPSERIRVRAADLLGEMKDLQVVGSLGSVLDDPAIAKAAARSLGHIGSEPAREILLGRLQGDDARQWAPCAEALEASGWTPESPREVVRVAAAQSSWSAVLSLGETAIDELRAVLKRGSEPMRRGAAATLHTLGWAPRHPDAEFFAFLVARADWDVDERQHPGQRPSLKGWFEGEALASGPVRDLVASSLPTLEAPLYGAGLEDALRHENPRSRYVAAVACGLTRCAEAVPLLLANLNAPDDDPAFKALAFGHVRIAAAQAIAEVAAEDAASALLDHATRNLRSGFGPYSQVSEVAAIQGATRILGASKFFDRVPAAMLGRKVQDDPAFELDLWASFPLGENADAILLQTPLSGLVKAIAVFDRSEVPQWMYSDVAMFELHQRLAVLALAVVIVTASNELLGALARSALAQFWAPSALPVMRELAQSSVPALAELAREEQVRRSKPVEGE